MFFFFNTKRKDTSCLGKYSDHFRLQREGSSLCAAEVSFPQLATAGMLTPTSLRRADGGSESSESCDFPARLQAAWALADGFK